MARLTGTEGVWKGVAKVLKHVSRKTGKLRQGLRGAVFYHTVGGVAT